MKKWSFFALLAVLMLSACGPKDTRDPLLISAEKGDADAQLAWGNKEIAEGNYEAGLHWFALAAAQGVEEARIAEASLLIEGYVGQDRVSEGIEKFKILSEEDVEIAKERYALALSEGKLVEKDASEAFKLLSELLESGQRTPKVKSAWARMVLSDEMGGDVSVARTLVAQAAEENDGLAQDFLGRIAEESGDQAAAKDWYYRAALNGVPHAMLKTGIAYHRVGDSTSYSKIGFDYLVEAEKAGYVESLFHLGKAYYWGIGTEESEENRVKGKDLLFLAAGFGSLEAADYFLKIIYKANELTMKDEVESWTLLESDLELDKGLRDVMGRRLSKSLQDVVFNKRVKLSQRQIELRKKSYLFDRGKTVQDLSESEKTELKMEFPSSYGEHEKAFIAAIEAASSNAILDFARIVGDNSSSVFDSEEALWWLKKWVNKEGPASGRKIYEMVEDGQFEWMSGNDAISFLTRSVASDDADAAFMLAEEYMNGGRVDQDYLSANLYLNKATNLGHPKSRGLSMKLFEDGMIDVVHDADSMETVRLLAEGGKPKFRWMYASSKIEDFEEKHLTSFTPGVEGTAGAIYNKADPNWRERFLAFGISQQREHEEFIARVRAIARREELEGEVREYIDDIFKLAEEGEENAMRLAMGWYAWGLFVDEDDSKVYEFVKKLAESDGKTAGDQLLYGLCLILGFECEKDFEAGSVWIRKAAEEGNEYAEGYFADTGSRWDGPYESLTEVAYRAVELEDPEAMYLLARSYKDTKDLVQDLEYRKKKYMQWVGAAAKLGHTDSLNEIGMAYIEGDGVERNILRGMRFIEQAAKKGDADAQYVVGVHYVTGAEVPKDMPKGIDYLRQAADQGHITATQTLVRVEKAQESDSNALEKDAGIHTALWSGALNHDFYPVVPRVIEKGESHPIVSVKGDRPVYEIGGNSKSASKKSAVHFMSGGEFAKGKMVIEDIRVASPFINLGNGWVYTGLSPSLTFRCSPTSTYKNCYSLLVVRDRFLNYKYYWKSLGEAKKGKRERVKFSFSDMFEGIENVALYFFEGDKEVETDYRYQIGFFLDSKLSELSLDRIEYIKSQEGETKRPQLRKGIDSFLLTGLDYPEDAKVELVVSELGYVEEIKLPDGLKENTRDSLWALLGDLVFYPSIKDGVAKPSKVIIKIDDCYRPTGES